MPEIAAELPPADPSPNALPAMSFLEHLEELRRRYGESMRPQLELDYIERLLKDY